MPTTLSQKIDRRRFPRFVLPVAYTPVAIRTLHDQTFTNEGHAYDISEGGIRFEADHAIAPGTRVAIRLALPDWADDRGSGGGGGSGGEGAGVPGRAVFAFATVVWIEDEDEPGPVKMAAVFNEFCRAGDRERLLATFATGRYRLAA